MAALTPAADDVPIAFGTHLVDHHAHSVVREVRDRSAFERFLSEAGTEAPPGCSYFDSLLGAAVLHACGPVLGLDPGVRPDEYLSRRYELGEEATRMLLRAARVEALLVDAVDVVDVVDAVGDGFRRDQLVGPSALSELAAAPVHRIVRLERLAEQLASEGVVAGTFAGSFAERLASELAGPDGAVGCKSVLAYRHGLDVDPAEPSPGEVQEAVAEWLSEAARSGSTRLSHPVVLRHLVWAGIRAGKPLQFHVGYGDRDLELHRANPSLLTGLIRLAEPLGTPIMLLHCYPYHREAAYLAAVYPHVYFDIGLAVTYVGHRAATVLAEALETAYFHKVLYSSDAFGLAELHLLGAVNFRSALVHALAPLHDEQHRTRDDVVRVAEMIGSGNARRVYSLGDRDTG